MGNIRLELGIPVHFFTSPWWFSSPPHCGLFLSSFPSSLLILCSPPTHLSRLTAGTDNLLLHYVLLDNGRGLLLTPFSGQVSSQPVHRRLLSSFRHVATEVHVVLQRKWEEEEEEDQEEEEDVFEVEETCSHAKNSDQSSSQVRTAYTICCFWTLTSTM